LDETYPRLACASCGDKCAHLTPKVKARANARPLCECKQCGVTFKPKSSSRVTFCSRACSFAHKAEHAGPRPFTSVYFRTCTVCEQAFTTDRAAKTRCCRACDLKHASAWALRQAEALHRQDAKVVGCAECGCNFCPVYGASNATLCMVCKESRARAHKAASRLLRKAKERAAKVETVDPYKVFEQAGWLCRLCGVATPRVKRGSYEPDAPELDHIHPLSKGGEHSYANTQCACRACNAAKSDALEWEREG